jgi:hypothetical protein
VRVRVGEEDGIEAGRPVVVKLTSCQSVAGGEAQSSKPTFSVSRPAM